MSRRRPLSFIIVLFVITERAERGSKEFERFLAILGNKIRLKGWDKYRGGLDVKGTPERLVFFFFFCVFVLLLISRSAVINFAPATPAAALPTRGMSLACPSIMCQSQPNLICWEPRKDLCLHFSFSRATALVTQSQKLLPSWWKKKKGPQKRRRKSSLAWICRRRRHIRKPYFFCVLAVHERDEERQGSGGGSIDCVSAWQAIWQEPIRCTPSTRDTKSCSTSRPCCPTRRITSNRWETTSFLTSWLRIDVILLPF